MGIPEGHTTPHEVLGQVGRCGVRTVGRRRHAVGVERDRVEHAGNGAQPPADLVEAVEQRLLVLLQVAVVGEWQRLERGQQPGEVADRAPRLAPRQLGDVGVLLLRQHRRARRVGVGQADEAELLGRPHHDLLADAAQVQRDHREVEQDLGHEIAVADGVERVGERGGEPQALGVGDRVDGEAGAGERPRTERRHVEPTMGVDEAIEIAAERPEVGQQVVAQQHRLGLLQMGVAGQVGVAGLVGPSDQHVLEGNHPLGDRRHRVLAEQAERRGHLVVAAPARVEAGAGVAGQLGDPPLDRGVDVLVGLDVGELARGQFGLGGVERRLDRSHLRSAEDAGHAQPGHVGPAAADVEAGEALVEGQAERVLPQLGGGPFGESAVPQGLCGVLVLVRHRSSN